MRTAALLLPLALAATFTSAPLLAASASSPAPATATNSQLHLQTFHPGPQAMFSVSSVLIEGRHDAILVNAQFGASDARKLVELIRASGKQLTTIYISHGDPDYYFGLATLQDAFPQARIVATAQTVAHIQQTQAGKLAYWGPKMGADVPARIVVPQVLDGDALQLEGQRLPLIGLDGPTPDRTVLWVPSLRDRRWYSGGSRRARVDGRYADAEVACRLAADPAAAAGTEAEGGGAGSLRAGNGAGCQCVALHRGLHPRVRC